MTRRDLLACSVWAAATAQAKKRPNILWISCEDTGPELGCYGDPHAITPNIDALARVGTRFTHAYSVAGVCAPSRSGIITGMYPSTLGSTNMRSDAQIPEHVKPFPWYLRQAGYYCTNNAKTDYNFKHPKDSWDEVSRTAHWKNRPADKPFFAVFNIETTHESRVLMRGEALANATKRVKPEQRQDPAKLQTLPPFYPDTPEVRRDWANYYELITDMDTELGERLRELSDAGLEQDTIVFFWGDHGVGLPRSKRWLYESGTHVPLVVRIPGQPAKVDPQLVSLIDLGPTVLHLAGLKVPEHMSGRAFLGDGLTKPREFVHGARDRMDETYDLIRTVRDQRYRYIRNYMPERPYDAVIETCDSGNVMKEMRRVPATPAGKLFFSGSKPIEELYDTENDRWELTNLASSPKYRTVLDRMRREHVRWTEETRDTGFLPEVLLDEEGRVKGSRWAILKDALPRQRRLRELATTSDQKVLRAALKDPDPAARCWALRRLPGASKEDVMPLLGDPSAIVRVQAAKHAGDVDLLRRELQHPNDLVKLAAAHALEDLGELARPALAELNVEAKRPRTVYSARVSARVAKKLLRGTAN